MEIWKISPPEIPTCGKLAVCFGHEVLLSRLVSLVISRNNLAGHYRRVATAPLRFLFHFDTGSDGLVVVGLYNKCHTYYAINVLTVIVLPGVIYGWYIRSTERRNKEKIPTWMVPFAPLWFIPYSIYKLFLAILESSGGPGPGKL